MPNGNWLRVTRTKPCSICRRPNAEHTSTWCLRARDGTAAICPFTPDGGRNLGAAGYLHKLNGAMPHNVESPPRPRTRRLVDWAALTKLYQQAAPPEAIRTLATGLGLTLISLLRLGIGRCNENVWTFPMRNDKRGIIGLRLRNGNGEKSAIRDSRNGLFIPDGLTGDGPLLVCEGPTDTAAALDLGFNAIGRADCNTTVFVAAFCIGREVVVVADTGDPGQAGAATLHAHLRERRIKTSVWTPPAKDLRAACMAGLTRANVPSSRGRETP